MSIFSKPEIENEEYIKFDDADLLTYEDYKKSPIHWFINHPCVCYKKSAVLTVGNYNEQTHSLYEDFELELKLLKKFGKVYNIQENLLYYRIHDKQVTAHNSCSKTEIINARNDFIKKLLMD
jgi:GT2 family glycosyltransferase